MANCVQCGRKLPPFSFRKICQWCVQHEAAKRGEEAADMPQPVMAVPWSRRESSISLTKVLFGANVAVFIAMVVASGSIEAFPGPILGHFGANFGPYTLSGEWWRLLTYMFLHADFWHIAFNMWCLWSLGGLCESLYGTFTFGAVYIITGIAGGLASVAWHPLIPSVGASGAIFGLAGALIASLYLGEFNIPSYVIQSNLKSLLFFAGFNILFGISPIGNLFGINVDNACHIGGLVSGLILGALIARVAPGRDLFPRTGILLLMTLAVLTSAVGIQRWRGRELQFDFSAREEQNIQSQIAALKKKIQQNPNDASAHYALAHAYFSSGQVPDSESELKRVLELDPQNAGAHMDLGVLYLDQDDAAAAEEQFSKLTAQQPANARAHVGLGMALADEKKHDGAVREYQTALRLDPRLNGVYYLMGVSQAELKRYDDAIASLLKGREAHDDASLESALADAYEAKGMTQQAKDARNRSAQLKRTQQD
jgi:membrane associated rhomboid family serine protease/Flp pilus assembly protein TadD